MMRKEPLNGATNSSGGLARRLRTMRACVLLLGFICVYTGGSVRAAPWRPAPGHLQVAIWPTVPPDQPAFPGPEWTDAGGVNNVSQPTMTLYPARGRNTGAAVVVIPGGGFKGLAIGLEGTEVCDWLTAKGINCVLLKYRVPTIPYVWQCDCRPHNHDLSLPSLQDTQRTMRLVRARARQWGIDPRRLGVMGFSAGGFLVAEISTYYGVALYKPVDAADTLSSRPDFAIAVYPGHLAMAENSVTLNPLISSHITARTPPTFILQNEDDHTDRVEDALSYYMGLKKKGVAVELHAFAKGGHAFGLRPTKLPVDRWPLLVEGWLSSLGVLNLAPVH